MPRRHALLTLIVTLGIAGCAGVESEKEPLRITPKSEIATSPVVRESLPSPSPPAAVESAPIATPASADAASAAPSLAMLGPASTPPPFTLPAHLPPGTLYVCSATLDGQVKQTAIEYEPRVKLLCSRHPEMGVCQYEREACRASGGRVFTATGVEITRQTEAEYDQKVIRVRFRAG